MVTNTFTNALFLSLSLSLKLPLVWHLLDVKATAYDECVDEIQDSFYEVLSISKENGRKLRLLSPSVPRLFRGSFLLLNDLGAT